MTDPGNRGGYMPSYKRCTKAGCSFLPRAVDCGNCGHGLGGYHSLAHPHLCNHQEPGTGPCVCEPEPLLQPCDEAIPECEWEGSKAHPAPEKLCDRCHHLRVDHAVEGRFWPDGRHKHKCQNWVGSLTDSGICGCEAYERGTIYEDQPDEADLGEEPEPDLLEPNPDPVVDARKYRPRVTGKRVAS